MKSLSFLPSKVNKQNTLFMTIKKSKFRILITRSMSQNKQKTLFISIIWDASSPIISFRHSSSCETLICNLRFQSFYYHISNSLCYLIYISSCMLQISINNVATNGCLRLNVPVLRHNKSHNKLHCIEVYHHAFAKDFQSTRGKEKY